MTVVAWVASCPPVHCKSPTTPLLFLRTRGQPEPNDCPHANHILRYLSPLTTNDRGMWTTSIDFAPLGLILNTYNYEPRPRVLFEDVPSDIYEELSKLVPTSQLIRSDEKIYEAEFDLLVTYSDYAGSRYDKLHVLSLGASSLGLTKTKASRYSSVTRTDSTLAREATMSPNVDSELRKLIEDTVIQTLPQGEKPTWDYPMGILDTPTAFLSLGVEMAPYLILMKRTAAKDSSQLLALPDHVDNIRSWFVWFLKYLHSLSPDIFPGEADWASSPNWTTADTAKLYTTHSAKIAELNSLIAKAEEVTNLSKTELENALLIDATGLQQLLTEDGDALETQVIEALTLLGFEATSMDAHHVSKGGAKLEDLRISDPSDPTWFCLAEVKGYSKGVKTNDINQITGKPLIAYIQSIGSAPSALWHIVNFKRTIDPSTRGEAVPRDLDLEHLHTLQGKLIDSRQLFLAVKDFQMGKNTAQEIRHSLKDPAMRWDYRCI